VGRPLPVAEAVRPLVRKRKHPTLCLNLEHPNVSAAAALMRRAPRLAALLWARQLLVRHGLLDAKTDAYLTAWSLGGRHEGDTSTSHRAPAKRGGEPGA
jgi:hypothetical protein